MVDSTRMVVMSARRKGDISGSFAQASFEQNGCNKDDCDQGNKAP